MRVVGQVGMGVMGRDPTPISPHVLHVNLLVIFPIAPSLPVWGRGEAPWRAPWRSTVVQRPLKLSMESCLVGCGSCWTVVEGHGCRSSLQGVGWEGKRWASGWTFGEACVKNGMF